MALHEILCPLLCRPKTHSSSHRVAFVRGPTTARNKARTLRVVQILRCHTHLQNLRKAHARFRSLTKCPLQHTPHLNEQNKDCLGSRKKKKHQVTENLDTARSNLHLPDLAVLVRWGLHQSAHIVLQAVAVGLCPTFSLAFSCCTRTATRVSSGHASFFSELSSLMALPTCSIHCAWCYETNDSRN